LTEKSPFILFIKPRPLQVLVHVMSDVAKRCGRQVQLLKHNMQTRIAIVQCLSELSGTKLQNSENPRVKRGRYLSNSSPRKQGRSSA